MTEHPSRAELQQKLREAEAVIAAVRNGEVDGVVQDKSVSIILLAEVARELRASEQRYRNVITDAPIPVMLHTVEGDVLALSRHFTEATGYTRRDIPTYRAWLQKAYGASADAARALEAKLRVEHMQPDARRRRTEETIRTKSGEERIWLVCGSYVRRALDDHNLMVTMALNVTEHRQAEAALRDLAKYPAEDPNPVLRIGADGELLYANPASREMLEECGCCKDGKPAVEWRRLAREARDDGGVRRSEVQCGGRTLAMSFVPVEDADYTNVYGLDISLRKRAEDALMEAHKDLERTVAERTRELSEVNRRLQNTVEKLSRARDDLAESTAILESVFDNTHMLIAYMDRNFNFIRVNRAYAAADEATPEALVGQNHFDLYPNPENEQLFRRVIETGQPYKVFAKPFEYESAPERGTTYWDWSLQPVFDEAGAVEGLILCLVDVTERFRAKEEVDRARSFAVNIVQTLHEAVLVLDAELNVLHVNATFYRMFGGRPEDTEGRPIYGVAGRRLDIAELRELLETVIPRDAEIRDYEFELRLEEMGRRILRVNARRIVGETGEGERILLAIEDVTERRRALRAVERSRQRLRALTARSVEMVEEERQRMAREVHDGLGQELTALKTGLGVLRRKVAQSDGQIDPELVLDRIDQMLDDADATVETVRDISRRLRPATLDELGLGPAIEEEAEAFENRTGIACRVDLPERPVTLDGERSTAMFRILCEALANIERHAGAESVEITLSVTSGKAVLSVSDDGVGITDEQQESPQSLGLLGMKERAFQLDGNVTILGQPGEGTTVTLSLPTDKKTRRRRDDPSVDRRRPSAGSTWA